MEPLSGDQTSKQHHNLGDTLAIGALAVPLLTWALAPSLYAKVIAVIFAIAISVYLSYRSHFVRSWTTRRKHGLALIVICLLVAISSAQLIPQWNEEHRKTSDKSSQSAQQPAQPVQAPAKPDNKPQQGGTIAQTPPVVHHRPKRAHPAITAQTATVPPLLRTLHACQPPEEIAFKT
jgi:hypothetical protein